MTCVESKIRHTVNMNTFSIDKKIENVLKPNEVGKFKQKLFKKMNTFCKC